MGAAASFPASRDVYKRQPGSQPPEEEAVAAFAAGSLFTEENTPENEQQVEDNVNISSENSDDVDAALQNTGNFQLQV